LEVQVCIQLTKLEHNERDALLLSYACTITKYSICLGNTMLLIGNRK